MTDDKQTETRRTSGSVLSLALWTLAWVATLALAQFGPQLWGSQPVLTWLAIAINLAVGIGWIVAHARWLRTQDDLQRKILMDALALALGVGLVGSLAYAVASSNGLIDFDFGLAAVFPVLAGVTYMIATAVGTFRYR